MAVAGGVVPELLYCASLMARVASDLMSCEDSKGMDGEGENACLACA